jgi:hypothetical protein
LAQKINKLMRGHFEHLSGKGAKDARRNEAIDAYDAARILVREPTNEDSSEGRT